MTTAHDIDLPSELAERLTTCHPDVLRELLATFIHTLMGAPPVRCRIRPAQRRVDEPTQRDSVANTPRLPPPRLDADTESVSMEWLYHANHPPSPTNQ